MFFQQAPRSLRLNHWTELFSLLLPPRVFGFNRDIGIRRKITIIIAMKNHRTTNITRSVYDSTVHATSGCGSGHSPQQRKQKASRRKVHLTSRGGRGWGSITINIVWQKQETKTKTLVKKKGQKGTQAALQSVGCGAQNWPALLGSHCRRRTMDGSLLAPRMNSSRDSFPRKQKDRCAAAGGSCRDFRSSHCILVAATAHLLPCGRAHAALPN